MSDESAAQHLLPVPTFNAKAGCMLYNVCKVESKGVELRLVINVPARDWRVNS